jgi:hypothetical protein
MCLLRIYLIGEDRGVTAGERGSVTTKKGVHYLSKCSIYLFTTLLHEKAVRREIWLLLLASWADFYALVAPQ